MPGRRNAFGLIDVLQPDRDAVQRPTPAPSHDLGFGRARSRERYVGEHPDKAIELAVEPIDARQAALHQIDGRELAAADQRAGFGDRQKIRHHNHSPGGGKIWAGSAAISRFFRTRAAISSMKWAAAIISGFSRSGISSPARASAASTSARVMPWTFMITSP